MFTRVHSASPRSASQQQPKSRTPGWTLLEDTARIAPQADHRPPSLPSWKNMRFLLKMMSQTHARPGIPSRAGKITASRRTLRSQTLSIHTAFCHRRILRLQVRPLRDRTRRTRQIETPRGLHGLMRLRHGLPLKMWNSSREWLQLCLHPSFTSL